MQSSIVFCPFSCERVAIISGSDDKTTCIICLHTCLESIDLFHYLILLFTQVVELDFLYPSEGIHRRWESGYRITSTAATADQAAFILSIPKRKLMDETQETLRTSAFPSNHVKVRVFPAEF